MGHVVLEDKDGEEEEIASSFEKLLDSVVSDGWYQWRLILLFMIPFSLFYGFAEFNIVLLLSSPDHVCHVPGRENTNFTLEEWHNMSIPWELGPDGLPRHSQCIMFNYSVLAEEEIIFDRSSTAECTHGWDYQQSDWRSTPITDFDWVCNDENLVTHIYTIKLAGAAIGTFILSVLSDNFGRKPIFLLTLVLNLLFSLALLVAPTFMTFGLSTFFMALAFYTLYQMPFLIVLEVCSQRLRGIATLTSFLAMVGSSMYISLTAWLTADWKWFLMLNHLPVEIYLLLWMFIPESPRWLLSQGRLDDCEEVMTKIATVNGTKFTDEMRQLMKKAQVEEKKKVPVTKIFSSFVLTKHLFLTCILLSLGYILLISISLNVHNMTGNLFVNFFVLSLFEIPGNIFGSVCSQNLGRRLSAVICLLLCSISILTASFFIKDEWASTSICGISKLFLGGGILIVYMQIGELFPTQLRATAYGITGVVGLAASVTVPSLMAMGSINAAVPYYIMFTVGLIATISASFLPETLRRPLPQTLKEANQIGKNQPYFSLIHKWNALKLPNEITTIKNKSKPLMESENYTVVST